jgi:uncharacterized 2Fe-2S/4Fe-4S cluster protein (DUF4445 family)
MAEEVKVTFEPAGRSVFVLPGTSLMEAAGRAGLILQSPCGGQGTCGKCKVQVTQGQTLTHDAASRALPQRLHDQGFRLACLTKVDGPAVVDIPPESLFESRHQILVADSGRKGKLSPVIRKTTFSLPQPGREDGLSDLARLRNALGDLTVPHDVLQQLPGFLRRNQWHGTAVCVHKQRVIALEPGDTSTQSYGVAFDIGTTTVVGTLLNLVNGQEVAVASRLNPQIAHGDDVLSRILKVRQNPSALQDLQGLIVGAANEIIRELANRAGISVDNIYEVVIAGNSTMQEIFCGLDPSPLGEVPFTQTFDRGLTLRANKVGLHANPAAELYVFPQIGGFVGGDTTAGMLAATLDKWKEPVLLVDIGTNGEIVLAVDGKMWATSTAAGPAFEGARIRQGMRATSGAIEKVLLRGDVAINVIDNARPAGLCGTALIDTVAELLRAGLLDETGHILAPDEAPASVPEALRARLTVDGSETHFLLVESDAAAGGTPIMLWQRDVRELQLASGAIRAGINLLLRRAGVAQDQLGAVLLAGAFGNFIRRSNALRIGLLPPIPCDRIRFIGNAASLGAKLALLSDDERKYAEKLRENCEHVDLSLDPEFQNEFSMAMMFPTLDPEKCEDPSASQG